MKKVIITSFLVILFLHVVNSQNGDNIGGGPFIKRIENNKIVDWQYNLSSKSAVEKLFFGEINAPIEFFYHPSFEGAYGFRVMKDSLNNCYMLEIKLISNYEEAHKEALNKNKSIGIPANMMSSMPKDIRELIAEHNKAVNSKYFEELPKLYKIKTLVFQISEQFAGKLHKKMVFFIENFVVKDLPHVINDGYDVTFRTVVEYEVWSLSIHVPQGKAEKLSNLCRQIVKDAIDNKLDESKYMSILDK